MTNETQDAQTPDELELLKARAKQLGIKHHPSIGLDALKTKISEALEDAPAAADAVSEDPASEAPVKAETPAQQRARLRREATKLVRVNVTCMNPAKREWPGEIFTVSNKAVGTIKRYVPFNTDDGWHIEEMILKMLEARQCQIFHTVRDSRGNKIRKGKLIKEFAIDRLPALNQAELEELARRQAAQNSIDSE